MQSVRFSRPAAQCSIQPGITCALGVVLLLLPSSTYGQDNWPRFRGANADGLAPDHESLPMSWTTSENVKWVADVPGWGWSCPIVWGNRVFLTTVVSDEENENPKKGLYLGQGVRDPAKGVHHWLVYCFDLDAGKILWQHEAHTGQPKVPRHPKSTYAAETPTTDGERVYVLFGDLGLYSYDMAGKPLWSKFIEPKKTVQDYGAASSPVAHNGQVFVVYDNLEDSWIAAFDAKAGNEQWRTARDETHSWATPLVWNNELRTELVVPGKNRNRSYSLDGKLLWEFDGKMSNLVIPSPFAAHGLCYISSGYIGDFHRPTFAIRPGASGDLAPNGNLAESEFVAWYQGQASPLQHVTNRRWRLPIHALRPRVSDVPRRQDRQGDLWQATVHSRRFLHRVAVGLQRSLVLLKRRGLNVRGQARARVRDPWDQRPR
jgi:outer membrane protein assembly factor BamB